MLAENLKKELKENLLKDIPQLQDRVIDQINSYGNFSIICDKHINRVSTFSIPQKYKSVIEEWAKENGFITYNTYNSYGVKSLNIKLPC